MTQRGDFGERIALASARVPFQLKVGAVWVVLFALLGSLFYLADYDTEWMRENFTFILRGLQFTLLMALGGIVLATILATLGALARLSRNPVLYGVSGFYVSFFRGTPLIVQMFLVYLALPQVGGNLVDRYPGLGTNFQQALILEAATAGTIALGLNYGAYMTEIFRAGIQSVAHGQGEAADALGMRYGAKMRRVVLPQAMRVIIPPTGNEFIAMMKDTALVSFLGVAVATAEMFRRSQLVGKADFKNLEAYVLVALFYWALTAVFTFFQSRLEARMETGYVRESRSILRAAGRTRTGGLGRDRRRRPGPGDRAAQGVREPHRAPRRRPRAAPWRGDRHLRPVRVGQVHAAALRELPRGPDRRHHRDRRAAADRRHPHPSQARADPAGPAAMPAWSSSSSTCSPTSPLSRT